MFRIDNIPKYYSGFVHHNLFKFPKGTEEEYRIFKKSAYFSVGPFYFIVIRYGIYGNLKYVKS